MERRTEARHAQARPHHWVGAVIAGVIIGASLAVLTLSGVWISGAVIG